MTPQSMTQLANLHRQIAAVYEAELARIGKTPEPANVPDVPRGRVMTSLDVLAGRLPGNVPDRVSIHGSSGRPLVKARVGNEIRDVSVIDNDGQWARVASADGKNLIMIPAADLFPAGAAAPNHPGDVELKRLDELTAGQLGFPPES